MPHTPTSPASSEAHGSETETEVAPPTGATPARSSKTVVLACTAVGLALVALVIMWPRKPDRPAAAEIPPTLEHAEEAAHGGEHSGEGAIEVPDETAELMGLETEEVAEGEIEKTIAAPGRVLVAPNAQAIIGAKVTGRVVRVAAEPGQRVAAGQALVVVDSPLIADLRGQLVEARSRLALAEQKRARVAKAENRSAAIQAKTRLDLAEANLERKRRLVGVGALPARDLQDAEAEQKNAKAEYDYQTNIQVTREQQEADAESEQARATVARLTQSLAALGASPDGEGGSVALASPIAGSVVARNVSIGETVTEDKELLTVMNLSSVVVEAQLPESQASRVARGQRLVARIPGVEGGVFEGQVEVVGDTVDPAKRTVSVRARVTNAGARLKHEMAVEVQIGSGVRGEGLTIPVSALVDDEGRKVVYVREGEKYERRIVTVGSISYGRAEVTGGLEAGEQVVTKGAYQLANMAKGGEEGGDHDDHDE